MRTFIAMIATMALVGSLVAGPAPSPLPEQATVVQSSFTLQPIVLPEGTFNDIQVSKNIRLSGLGGCDFTVTDGVLTVEGDCEVILLFDQAVDMVMVTMDGISAQMSCGGFRMPVTVPLQCDGPGCTGSISTIPYSRIDYCVFAIGGDYSNLLVSQGRGANTAASTR